jgi:hypothetical protein
VTLDETGATFSAGTVQVRHDCGAVDIKGGGQFVDGCAPLVHGDELGNSLLGQSRLFMVERWDGSMGRSVTPLTSENAVQTCHVVGVGVTAQQVHSRKRR